MEIESLTTDVGEGQDGAVDRQETDSTADAGTQNDSASEAGENDDGTADRQKEAQDRETNARIAAARRKAEAETRERLSRESDERIASMRIPNPTKPGEYFKSMAEMDEYSKALKRSNAEERAKREKRDVSEILEEDENREYLSRKRREEAEKKKTENQQEFIRKDIEDFRKAYPGADIAKIEGNSSFRRFAGSRFGAEPLAELWADYQALMGGAEEAAKAKQSDRENRSTGSGNGGKTVVLSAAQQKMLDQWNEQYPEMKMSAKEFLNR